MAASALSAAGYIVEEVTPPHFEEGAQLWNQLVMDDMRRSGQAAIESLGDEAVKTALRFYMTGLKPLDRDGYLNALTRRLSIARAWSLFLAKYPVLLMPISWQKQFKIDEDRVSAARMKELLAIQSPLLITAMLGLPGLSVPIGVAEGLPTGVQIVATRYREDIALAAGEVIERAIGFSALDILAPR